MISRDPAPYAWWLASRSAGVVAFLLISTAVVLGLFNASAISRRPGLKRTLVKVHEQVALAALVAIGAHGVLLLGDPWLKPGISGISLPFTMSYRPLWTGLGIVAGYLAALLGLTFYHAPADRRPALAAGPPRDGGRLCPGRRAFARLGDGRRGALVARHGAPRPSCRSQRWSSSGIGRARVGVSRSRRAGGPDAGASHRSRRLRPSVGLTGTARSTAIIMPDG